MKTIHEYVSYKETDGNHCISFDCIDGRVSSFSFQNVNKTDYYNLYTIEDVIMLNNLLTKLLEQVSGD